MLHQAHKLQEPIQRYISSVDDESVFLLGLTNEEWQHVEYLLQLLRDFYIFTKSISKHNGVTIHKIGAIIYA